MPAIDINSWITSLLDQLQANQQRQLVVLQGTRSWCDERFETIFQLHPTMQVLSNRNLVASATPFSKTDACLGSEARLVAMDLFEGFSADVLCIAAGLVCSGGILLLLSPIPRDWDMASDHYARWQGHEISRRAYFAEYFFNALEEDGKAGVVLTEEFDFASAASLSSLPVLQRTTIEDGQTTEQRNCLQRVEQWLSSGRNGIVLINAGRGRGKSTCLGLLVKKFQSSYKILLSANSKQTAGALLDVVPDAEFVAPDRLLQHCPEADLLVIDEAAMIPLSILHRLSRIYPRLVMATTHGGYEGTGQGFMLRFVSALEQHELIRLELEKPVRWCQQDHLEYWLDHCLMLADDSTQQSSAPDLQACELRLLEDPTEPKFFDLLKQVYPLLNSAHYRTRPSDLRMLMENPDLVLIVACCEGWVVAAALLNIEGGFETDMCEEIFLGRRRPRGHLLAQMLTAQAGLRYFARYRGIRIQRIAVAGHCRRNGLGTRLLQRALRYASDNSLDYVGASFALDPDTACFWQHAGFKPVHISYGKGKSSGSQSIAVLQAVNAEISAEMNKLQQRISLQLPTWMTQFLQDMDARQVVALLRYVGFDTSIDEIELSEIEAFALGNKGFELCFASLQKYVMQRVAQSDHECDALLIEKAIQNRHWNLLERESGSEGRKQLQTRLRGQVDDLIKAC
ncbi:MAG: tRNA(Met) cytidine acetyltransferase [Gammaproteobacteria bacterium]|nr:tRNA(Met) cytidine acetyltransferase [Gammaproteobacteria bacterium]